MEGLDYKGRLMAEEVAVTNVISHHTHHHSCARILSGGELTVNLRNDRTVLEMPSYLIPGLCESLPAKCPGLMLADIQVELCHGYQYKPPPQMGQFKILPHPFPIMYPLLLFLNDTLARHQKCFRDRVLIAFL